MLSVIDDLDSVNSRQISSEYSKVFKDALAKIHEFADTMKYNATMNQNIFYLADVGFTKEEIADYIGSIDFHFNRYMLTRNENESLEDYLVRLRGATNDGTLRTQSNKDY